MSRTDRYPIAQPIRQACRVLDLQPERILRRAGLSEDFLANEGKGVVHADFFRLWEAFWQEAGRPDLPIYLGKVFSRGPFNSAVFAFSCSPDVETGLRRLALFKPLIGPCRLDLKKTADALHIGFASTDPATPFPATMSAFELVYFLELVRFYTNEEVSPLSVQILGSGPIVSELEAFFAMKVEIASRTCLSLSRKDAARPLISENAELWEFFEPQLRRKLAEREQHAPAHVRVRNALMEMLPAGEAGIEDVCQRMLLSKRTLQRQLKEEGHSYQSLLDATRSELALVYLSRGEMSVEEISYLLAYRDPNSFYRAFHAWTGMTPQQARQGSEAQARA